MIISYILRHISDDVPVLGVCAPQEGHQQQGQAQAAGLPHTAAMLPPSGSLFMRLGSLLRLVGVRGRWV